MRWFYILAIINRRKSKGKPKAWYDHNLSRESKGNILSSNGYNGIGITPANDFTKAANVNTGEFHITSKQEIDDILAHCDPGPTLLP